MNNKTDLYKSNETIIISDFTDIRLQEGESLLWIVSEVSNNAASDTTVLVYTPDESEREACHQTISSFLADMQLPNKLILGVSSKSGELTIREYKRELGGIA